MYLVGVFMCLCLVNNCNSLNDLYEGSECAVDGSAGICKNIKTCLSAIEGLKAEIHPQICSFSGVDPIVCCLDTTPPTTPETTTKDQSITSTTPAEPTTPALTLDGTDSKFLGEVENKQGTKVSAETEDCPPIPLNKTAAKTGQKAWDKCIEYQEQLVLPCDPSKKMRFNYCRSDLNVWILNGEDAHEGEFPHMALLGYGSDPLDLTFLCGGSLISDSFVLTAGHCTTSRQGGPISYVLLGILKRSEFNQSNLHKILAIHKHPNYVAPKKYNDIALLQLETPVKLSYLIIPACLDVGDMSSEEVATATGWGTTEFRGRTSDILQKVDLKKFTELECMSMFRPNRLMQKGYDSNTQICYGDRTMSKDTCQGDSGGPLQVRHKIYCMYSLIGVTSFGYACGVPGQPALYTKVAHYLPWIEALVWPDE